MANKPFGSKLKTRAVATSLNFSSKRFFNETNEPEIQIATTNAGVNDLVQATKAKVENVKTKSGKNWFYVVTGTVAVIGYLLYKK